MRKLHGFRDLDLAANGFSQHRGGGKPICFVEHPIFLVADPTPLCRKWAQIPVPIKD
jgi:hypothetical protein